MPKNDEFLQSVMRGDLDDVIGYKTPTALPSRAEPAPSAWRRVPDIGVAALKSAVAVPEMAVGLLDIPTGGAVGRGVEKAGVRFKDTQAALSEMYSPQQKAAQARVSEGFKEGFIPGVSAAIRNPSTIATTIGESAAPMLAGGVAARGIKAVTGVAPWLAGALGEGAVGAGSAAESLRQESDTGYLGGKQTGAAIASGAGTALFGAFGAKIAKRFGLGDLETAMASGKLNAAEVGKELAGEAIKHKGFVKRMVGSGISEGVFEELPQSAQEQMWQNYATDRPLTEGLSEASGMGMLAGVGMGGTVGALSGRRDLTKKAPAPSEVVSQPTIDTEGTVPDMFTGIVGRPQGEALSGWTEEHQSALDDAIRQTAPSDAQAEMFAPRQQGVAGEAAKFGATTGAGGTKVVRGKAARAQKVATEAVPVKATPRTRLLDKLDAHIADGSITPDQYTEFVNDLGQKIAPSRVENRLKKVLREVAPAAPVAEAKPVAAPVTITTPTGESTVVTPTARRGDRSRKAEVGAAKRAVATEPAPAKPLREEDVPAYEVNATRYVTSGVAVEDWLAVARVRAAEQEAEGGESVVGESFRAAAKVLGVTPTTVRKRFNRGLSQMKANAAAAEMDWGQTAEMLGIAAAQAEPLGLSDTAYEGGARTAAAGEEFDPTYGMERAETAGEGAVDAEGAQEAEVSTEEVLDVAGELDAAEQLMKKFTPEVSDLAAAAWGEGFSDLHQLTQYQFTADIFDLVRTGVSADNFTNAVDKLKGEQYGEARELGVGAETQGGEESFLGTPRTALADDGGSKNVVVTVKKRRQISRSETEAAASDEPNTTENVKAVLRKMFMSPARMDKVVRVVDSEEQLPDSEGMEPIKSSKGAVQGFYDPSTGVSWLIAGNIDRGNELAVTLHEVGVHMGMKSMLGEKNYTALTDQLKSWYHEGTGTESRLAMVAGNRVLSAQRTRQNEAVAEATADAKEAGITLPEDSIARIRSAARFSDAEATEEMLAYFVEEAVISGIDPTALGSVSKGLRAWFKMVMDAVKSALRKLGINPASLTAQDIVDLAYGAANLEMRTPPTAPTAGDKMYSMAPVAGKTIPSAIEWNQATISKGIKDQARHMMDVGLDKVMFTEDLVQRAVKRGLSTAKEFGRLMAEKMATRDLMEQDIANVMSRAYDLKPEEKAAASAFMRKSTLTQKWGYKPSWDAEAVVDPTMASEFRKLSEASQAVVKDVFQFGNDSHTRLQTAINQDINDEFDALAATATTQDEKNDIEVRRASKIAQVGKIMPKLEGPYAPLKRFGDHVMVAMSKEYVAAKKNDDTAAMEKLQDDENHLLVEHFDSRAEAQARTDQLKTHYKDGSVESWAKQESYKHVNELPWAGIAKVKAAIEGLPEDSKLKRSMQHMLTDLYLSMMAETSARKSELKRKGVSGAEKDMFRSFASQGAATAHFITSLENSGDISRAMTQMQTDARSGDEGTRHDRTSVLNELTARYAQSLEYSQTPLVNRLMKITSFWMLLTSPAFYIQNSLQPFMITLPVLSGRFGAKRAWSEMLQAYKDIGKYAISAGAHQLSIDGLNISEKEKTMLKEMQKYGKLDLTLTQDMGRYTEGDSALDKGVFGKVMRKIWAGPQHIELLNRVASALAAYRLSTGAESDRLTYTGEIISKTHGNYSSFNAPRFFAKSGAMRLITQFRKFQLIQLTLLARLTHDSFKGSSLEERAVARRSMYWLLGQHAVMTGALGLPIPAVAWAIAASLGSGGDEPDDPEQWLRDLIGDDDVANLITRGVPAYFGLSMSQKIGMGGAFSALPFADIPKDRAGYEKFLVASLGATAGLGGSWFDAVGKMRKGDYYKGVETALPVGLKNAMKGYRFATEGVTSGAGDTLITPEDVSFVDSMAQGMGLPTMSVSERQRKQGVVIEANKFYSERSTDVKREYIKAYKAGDRSKMAEMREEWRHLQAARVANGFKRQPMGDLIKAPMAQRRRERAKAQGIEYTGSSKSFVESLT